MLRRLWSPSGLFDEIEFHAGINLIMGRYAGPRDDKGNAGINGIGKSSVVRLIDFLLLSDASRKLFAAPKYAWMGDEGHSACLDVSVGGTAIQIRRTFGADVDNVALRIGLDIETTVDERYAKTLLNGIFFPEGPGRIGVETRFRSLMPFYVKDDLTAHKRFDPVKFLTHGGVNGRDIAILTMYLLGLPNEDLVKLERVRSVREEEKRARDGLKKRLEAETGKSIEALRTELSNAEARLAELTKAAREFNLLEDFKEISAALSKLEADAAEQRKLIAQAERQVEKLRRFIDTPPGLDAEEVVSQYQEVSQALGAAMRRTLEEVIAFRRSLAQQRKRFHGKRLIELEETRDTALRKLVDLEQTRTRLMKAVDTTDFHETFDNALQRLATEHGALERQRAAMDQIKHFEARMSEFDLQMQVHRHDAAAALREVEDQVDAIRERFLEIVREAITTTADEGADAVFDIASQTGSATQLPVKMTVSVPRVDALGYARLLVVAYDLTVLLHQVDTDMALPRFLIHDGAFHAIARRTVVKTLNFIARQAAAAAMVGRPFQYITTFNEDELASADEELTRDGALEFDVVEATVITLSDAPTGGLFKRRFR